MSAALRFLLVGTAGYGVNVFVFGAVYGRGLPYAGAAVLAYLVANTLMYLGNRYFTFRLGGRGFWTAYVRYAIVGAAVAALTVAVLAALVELALLDARAGQAVALLLVSPLAFVLFKGWAFRVIA